MQIDEQQHSLIAELYLQYSDVLKPLLATVEAQEQKLPDTLLNEIRAFVDHLSRCYWADATPESIEKNVDRAAGHLKRARLDCMKHSVLWFDDRFKSFEKKTKRVDLTTISDGRFYVKYWDLRKSGIMELRQAKALETKAPDVEVFDQFQVALNTYNTLDVHIDDHVEGINWAKRRFARNWILGVLISVASIAGCGVVHHYWDEILNVFDRTISQPSIQQRSPQEGNEAE